MTYTHIANEHLFPAFQALGVAGDGTRRSALYQRSDVRAAAPGR